MWSLKNSRSGKKMCAILIRQTKAQMVETLNQVLTGSLSTWPMIIHFLSKGLYNYLNLYFTT